MNRNNIWIHIGLAVVLITIAAVVGQVDRWRDALRSPVVQRRATPPVQPTRVVRPESDAEVFVQFRPGTTLETIKSIAFGNHDRVFDNIESVNGLTFIDDLDNADPESVAEQYRKLGNVEFAEVNDIIKLDDPATGENIVEVEPTQFELGQPNDPLFGEQWALNNVGQNGGKAQADIGALKAWLKTQGSKDVVVAVLDTGVDYTHVDLRSNMWLRPDNVPAYYDNELGEMDDLHGFGIDSNLSDPMDDNGHGTHCAGVIGAEGNNGEGIAGINWKARIMPLKFLGRGGFGSTKNAIEAINYAIDRKKHGVNVRVISASWGSTQKSKALEEVIRAAGEEGILFIAAAGNNGTDNDKRPHYPSNYDLPNVISVAAVDRNDQLASFSNFGPKTVHIAAPGKDIPSTWLNDQYREASGTSMATPHVSGVAALIIASNPRISMAKLREKLLGCVDKIPSLEGKVAGGGRLNAAKAIN